MRLLLPPDTLVGSRKNSFGSSGDRVHIDSAALYDDLAAFSVGALVKMNTLTASRDIITKVSTTGWTLQLTDALGNFGLLMSYSMNDLSRITSSAALTVGVWQCLAATCNPSASAGDRIHLYASPNANAPLVLNEGSEGAPTGTRDTDAAHTLTLLNRTGGSNGLQADVPLIWISNRVLSLGELLAWQTNPLTPPPGCIGFWLLAEAGTIYDYSGREAHHSTLIQGTFLTPDVAPALQVPRGARIRALVVSTDVALTVQDAALGLTADSLALTQAHVLAVQDALIALGVESPALVQANVLVIQDALIALAAESLTLEVGGITLTVQDGVIALAAETPALTQANVLVVAEAAVALAAESPALTQAHLLAVADAAIALAAESPGLTQAHVLAVQDGAIALTVDPVTLSLSSLLEIADAAIALVSDGVALTQANQLAVADALISVAGENPALIQAHVLSVNGAAIALVADNVVLVVPLGLIPVRTLRPAGRGNLEPAGRGNLEPVP